MQSVIVKPDGKVVVEETPAPQMLPNSARVKVRRSLISTGTETDFIRARRAKPAEGDFRPGYSAVGTIVELAPDCPKGKLGQRVACAGWALATHSQEIVVPHSLFVPMEDKVEDDNAAFIGCAVTCMHALRQAGVAAGELVAVLGLGLFGQMVIRLAKAFGARVQAVAKHPHQFELAQQCCEQVWPAAGLEQALAATKPAEPADAAIIAAGGDQSEMVRLAGKLLRDRGTVVILGRGWAEIDFRQEMFQKELTLKNTRAYGPGRYDPIYERQCVDYPIGYVRWTENRNMAGVIDLMARGLLDLKPLITGRCKLADAPATYEKLMVRGHQQVAVVIEY